MLQIALPMGIAFLVSLLFGPVLIPILHKLKFGQSIREDGPQSHLKKAGTPTMGGFLIMLAVLVAVPICAPTLEPKAIAAIMCIAGFGLIGILDDGIKIVMHHNKGLKAWQKSLAQLILSIVIGWYVRTYITSCILIPFTNITVDLGGWMIPFMVFVMLATVNAVNLTDGLDGLAAGTSCVYFLAFALIYFVADAVNNTYLVTLCAALAGGCLGFLCFNANPAKVFMGDTGSLALGGAVAYVAAAGNMTLWILLMGGVFVASALSVVLQVASFKLTGKRIFRMAPLHHHFELKGTPEQKVVVLYVVTTAVLCLIGVCAVV